MLTFKQYITEVSRSISKATKLGLYLAKRHSKYRNARPDQINLSGYQKPPGKVFAPKESHKVVSVPLHKLIPIQKDVSFHNKHRDSPGHLNANEKMKDNEPIDVVHHVNTGKHYILDGHHRYMAAKLRGDTHISAYVHTHKD